MKIIDTDGKTYTMTKNANGYYYLDIDGYEMHHQRFTKLQAMTYLNNIAADTW